MLTIFLSLTAALAISSNGFAKKAPNPLPQTRLPYVEESEFAPEEFSVLYGSGPAHYESIMQFFGADPKNVMGRYCKLDNSSAPFACVLVIPDETTNTCSIRSYNISSLPIKALELDPKVIGQTLFDSTVEDPNEKLAAENALPKVGFSLLGTARAAVPPNLKVNYDYDIAKPKAEFDQNRSQPNAELIYMSKLTCNAYFKVGGAMETFAGARALIAERCSRWNITVHESNSGEVMDCKEAQRHALRPLTIEERSHYFNYTSYREVQSVHPTKAALKKKAK